MIALDISPQRLQRAKEFGADEVVDPGSNDPVAAIKDLTHGKYADLTLDTSSNPEARLNAIRSTKVWGTMCFVGEGGDVKIDVSPHLLRRQMTLVASWTFSNIIQAECADFCVERKVDVDKLFTHRWKLDQADEAYKLFDKQSDGKGGVPDLMRDDVAWLYKEAGARGLIVGSSGNVSARTPGGMVITPSGGDPETVTDGGGSGPCRAGWRRPWTASPRPASGPCTRPSIASAPRRRSSSIPMPMPAPPWHASNRRCRRFITWSCSSAAVDVRCAPYVTFGTLAPGRSRGRGDNRAEAPASWPTTA